MTGVYYESDRVQLWHGDMRDILPALGQFDACVTDPPYQETSLAWDRWVDGWPALVAGHTSSLWCFGSMRMFLDRAAEFAGWRMSQDVVWEKHNATGPDADRFRRVHEHALHWYRGQWRDVHREPQRVFSGVKERGRVIRNGSKSIEQRGDYREGGWVDDGTRLLTSVIHVRSMHRKGSVHPTQKPVDLLTPLIKYATPAGGTVLDCFAGSGSTAVAALAAGRRALLVEGDEHYCEVIATRLDQGVLDIGATP